LRRHCVGISKPILGAKLGEMGGGGGRKRRVQSERIASERNVVATDCGSAPTAKLGLRGVPLPPRRETHARRPAHGKTQRVPDVRRVREPRLIQGRNACSARQRLLASLSVSAGPSCKHADITSVEMPGPIPVGNANRYKDTRLHHSLVVMRVAGVESDGGVTKANDARCPKATACK
jgi:hypothetical protein